MNEGDLLIFVLFADGEVSLALSFLTSHLQILVQKKKNTEIARNPIKESIYRWQSVEKIGGSQEKSTIGAEKS